MGSPWDSQVAAVKSASTTRVGPGTSLETVTRGSLTYRRVSSTTPELHAASGVGRDLYAAARMVRSEISSGAPALAQLALAEMVRNAAGGSSKVYDKLVFKVGADYEWTTGWYGEQHGRWASTSRDPDNRSLAAARGALDGLTQLTNGAAKFFDPKTQDGGRQGGHALNYDAIGIAQKWGAEGWRWIGSLPGVDTYADLCCFTRQSGEADNTDLIKLIEDARAGRKPGPDLVSDTKGLPGWLLAAGAAGVWWLV